MSLKLYVTFLLSFDLFFAHSIQERFVEYFFGFVDSYAGSHRLLSDFDPNDRAKRIYLNVKINAFYGRPFLHVNNIEFHAEMQGFHLEDSFNSKHLNCKILVLNFGEYRGTLPAKWMNHEPNFRLNNFSLVLFINQENFLEGVMVFSTSDWGVKYEKLSTKIREKIYENPILFGMEGLKTGFWPKGECLYYVKENQNLVEGKYKMVYVNSSGIAVFRNILNEEILSFSAVVE